jgi:anti-sigma-K factor RskA
MFKQSKDEHIIDLIERQSFDRLSEEDFATIDRHVATCSPCHEAFLSAQLSSLLLRAGANELIEPSPFFQTRVMANWRERQTANELWGLTRLWRAAGALASSMAATVVVLGILTFAIPGNQPSISQELTAGSGYSAEAVIMNQSELDELSSDGQVLTTLYGAEEEPVR